MLTDPKLCSQVDALWDKFWTGGLANPLDAIEQFSYLLFLKRLDDRENASERQAKRKDVAYQPKVPKELRWGYWTQMKAEEALNRVVALDPANAHRTFYNLGLVIENRDDLTEADHRKAIEAYRKAIDLKPDYAIAHRDLGLALLRTGDMMGARKELAKYVQIEPNAKDAADIKATVKSLESAK